MKLKEIIIVIVNIIFAVSCKKDIHYYHILFNALPSPKVLSHALFLTLVYSMHRVFCILFSIFLLHILGYLGHCRFWPPLLHIFSFNSKSYLQIQGTAIGAPLNNIWNNISFLRPQKAKNPFFKSTTLIIFMYSGNGYPRSQQFLSPHELTA